MTYEYLYGCTGKNFPRDTPPGDTERKPIWDGSEESAGEWQCEV
eukprot:SAG31_NODE_40220_length_282_cov_0.846995_1_plen_43_part_01